MNTANVIHERETDGSTRDRAQPPFQDTRTCNKLRSVNWLTGEVDLMALDRGSLAKIDRRVFAELAHRAGAQAVKVPVSDAVWSTWRRYCEALGLSMGEGVAGLIAHELETVVSHGDGARDVFAVQRERQTEERAFQLDARERELDIHAERLRKKEAHLTAWERRIRTQRASGSAARAASKVGRNERCLCGSGLKYKHCHGLIR